MLASSFSVLLPVLFVLVLGYWAGRAKKFDKDQVKGINELVLDFALPAVMFVGIAKTTTSEAVQELPFLFAIFLGFLGFYLIVLLVSLYVLRHSIGEAALQAISLSFPSVAFMGIPIFKGLFGDAGVLSVTTATVIANLTIAPLTVVLLEVHSKRSAEAQLASAESEAARLARQVRAALASSLAQPMVWAPLSAIVLVLSGILVPAAIDNMLTLIGSTTSGVSLFAAGLIIAAYRIKMDAEIVGNVLVKMIGQPLFMAALVLLLAVDNPLGREAILMCAIPSSAFATLLAPRYGIYESESASTLVLATLAMVVVVPAAIILTA